MNKTSWDDYVRNVELEILRKDLTNQNDWYMNSIISKTKTTSLLLENFKP